MIILLQLSMGYVLFHSGTLTVHTHGLYVVLCSVLSSLFPFVVLCFMYYHDPGFILLCTAPDVHD